MTPSDDIPISGQDQLTIEYLNHMGYKKQLGQLTTT